MVAVEAVPAEDPKRPFPWPHQPALKGGFQGQGFPHIDYTWAGRPGILTAAQV